MNAQFAKGDKVQLQANKKEALIREFLGAGGQGEVYSLDFLGNPLALKWYFPHTAIAAQKKSLQLLIQKGAPGKDFLWPLDLAYKTNSSLFGYVMRLREGRYKSLLELMQARIDPDFKTLSKTGIRLAANFLQLHSLGLCYRDISFGNLFFDPQNGEILICDNDNVGIDGESISTVLGTPRFMAPEIVRGDATPSIHTDLFSLSVLLFYMFFIHHPLEGKRESEIRCLDMPAMRSIYGSQPLFIFDPQDSSNRPVKGIHDTVLSFWPLYPVFFKEKFIQAFTTGLSASGSSRVRESEWVHTLFSLLDSIFNCSQCGVENFYKENGPGKCWNCQTPLTALPYLQLDTGRLPIQPGKKLYRFHLGEHEPEAMLEPMASVEQHPEKEGITGLKNMTESSWECFNVRGEKNPVPPGKSVHLLPEMKIHFKDFEGRVCSPDAEI
ncbi:serine/threonine protein kinase [Candidatus Riflebacteria bacterium]